MPSLRTLASARWASRQAHSIRSRQPASPANGAAPTAAESPGRRTPSGALMQPTQRRLANAIRALAMDAVEAANSGHPGMPMGMADAATASVHPPSEVRSDRSALAGPRPLHPVGRPRLDADLRFALPDRLRAADDRGHQAFPPARLSPLRRAPREFRAAGRRGHDRAAWARASPWRSAWRSPSGISTRSTATIWSTIEPWCIAGDG